MRKIKLKEIRYISESEAEQIKQRRLVDVKREAEKKAARKLAGVKSVSLPKKKKRQPVYQDAMFHLSRVGCGRMK